MPLDGDDGRPSPLRQLVRLGWMLAALGVLLPVSMIVQIVQDGGIWRFSYWLHAELILGLLACNAGRLLVQKSSRSLGWGLFSAANLLIAAAGFLHFYVFNEGLLRLTTSDWVQAFVAVPNIFLQALQIPFLIYLMGVLLRPRWHKGLLAPWSEVKPTACRIVTLAGLGVGILIQLFCRLIAQRMTYK